MDEWRGSGSLNKGGQAGVASVWGASAGNCSVGGTCRDGSGRFQAYVVSQAEGLPREPARFRDHATAGTVRRHRMAGISYDDQTAAAYKAVRVARISG